MRVGVGKAGISAPDGVDMGGYWGRGTIIVLCPPTPPACRAVLESRKCQPKSSLTCFYTTVGLIAAHALPLAGMQMAQRPGSTMRWSAVRFTSSVATLRESPDRTS